MTARAVLFDLGQTLIDYRLQTSADWGDVLRARLVHLYPRFRALATALDDDLPRFVARAVEAMWPGQQINHSGKAWHFRERLRAALEPYGYDGGDPNELEALSESFYEPIRAATALYPETSETLAALRAVGLPLAIISNTPWDFPGRFPQGDMRLWRIDHYFHALVLSGDIPWRKPNREFMLLAARQLGVEAEHCLVVGDSLRADVAGAQAAGMPSVWVNRDSRVPPPEAPEPDYAVAALSDALPIIFGL